MLKLCPSCDETGIHPEIKKIQTSREALRGKGFALFYTVKSFQNLLSIFPLVAELKFLL